MGVVAKSNRISIDNQTRKMQKIDKLCKKFESRRTKLKKAIVSTQDYEAQQKLVAELDNLPKKSSRTRYKRICSLTSRRRGYMRDFGVSRLEFRRLARQGRLPGVVKSSW